MTDDPSETVFPERATRVSGRRLLAHITDGVLVTLIFIALLLPGLLLEGSDSVVGAILVIASSVTAVLWLFLGHLWWFVVQESKDGRTMGKRSAGIKVVTAEGTVPDRGQLWRRTVPLLIEYVYVFALIGMLASKRRQRFGDRWARTYVVSDQWEELMPAPT